MSISYTSACFGKVPAFGDFVNVHATEATMRTFDAWIQNGLRYMLGQGVRLHWMDGAPAFGFVFATGPLSPILIGYLKPSHDAVGRRYPFYITARVVREPFSGVSPWHLPIWLDTFVWAAQALSDDITHQKMSFPELRDRVQALDLLQIPEPNGMMRRVHEQLHVTRQDAFWSSFLPEGSGNGRFHLVHNLTQALTNQPLEAIWLPAPEGGMTVPILTFWLGLCRRISGGAIEAPSFFWSLDEETSSEHQPGGLWLFPRMPAAQALLSLFKGDHGRGGVKNLSLPHDGDDDAVRDLLLPRVRALLENPDLNLALLMDSL